MEWGRDAVKAIKIMTEIIKKIILSIFGLSGSNSCGESAYWKHKDNTLIIYGKGKMSDFGSSSQDNKIPSCRPWSLDVIKNTKRIVIKNGITHIGDYSFWGFEINDIVIADSVKSIGYCSLFFCKPEEDSNMIDLFIPDSVKSISPVAFSGNIRSIRVPESMEKVSYTSICNISGLEEIQFSGTKEQWDSLWINELVKPCNVIFYKMGT